MTGRFIEGCCPMLHEGEKVPTGLSGILVTKDDVKKGTEGKKTSISSLFKDKDLVLYFYPKDMTPGCTTEAQNFRDVYTKLKRKKVEIVGVSKDPVKSHCKFIDKHGLTFPLLSDEDGSICEAFGVWQKKKLYGKEFMGIVRSTFIIRKGKVIKAFHKVKVKEHADEIVEFFKK